MKYDDFIRELCRRSRREGCTITNKQARVFFELFKDLIEEILSEDDSVIFMDFIKFETRELKSKRIVNVNTGEPDLTSEVKTAHVRLSKNLKERVKINLELNGK